MSYYHPHFVTGLIEVFRFLSEERSEVTHEDYRAIARSTLAYFADGFPTDPKLICFLALLTAKGIPRYDRRRLAESIVNCLKKEQTNTIGEEF